jgi:hypothetical protein
MRIKTDILILCGLLFVLNACNSNWYSSAYKSNYYIRSFGGTILYKEGQINLTKQGRKMLNIAARNFINPANKEYDLLFEIYSSRYENEVEKIDCQRLNIVRTYLMGKFKIPGDRIHLYQAEMIKNAKINNSNFGIVSIKLLSRKYKAYVINPHIILTDTIPIRCMHIEF